MGGADFLWAQQVPLLEQKVPFFLIVCCSVYFLFYWYDDVMAKGVCFSQLLLCSFGDLMLCILLNLHGCATEIVKFLGL